MAMLMATIGNGGIRVTPTLLAHPERKDRPVRAISQRTADQLRSALQAPVTAWVPSASATWSLSLSQTAGGQPMAIAVFLSPSGNATEAARGIAQQITEAAKQ